MKLRQTSTIFSVAFACHFQAVFSQDSNDADWKLPAGVRYEHKVRQDPS